LYLFLNLVVIGVGAYQVMQQPILLAGGDAFSIAAI
jgi:hypothetical protein